jgi:hypothetical protein
MNWVELPLALACSIGTALLAEHFWGVVLAFWRRRKT